MAFTITDDHKRQLKVYKSLQDWQKDDPRHIRACLTEKMIEAAASWPASSAWTPTRRPAAPAAPTCSARRSISKSPALLHRLADEKLDGIRKELEAEGWGWIEINPERDWDVINRAAGFSRVLIDAPQELVELQGAARRRAGSHRSRPLQDTESDELLDQQEAAPSPAGRGRGKARRLRRFRRRAEEAGRLLRLHRPGRHAVHRQGAGQAGAPEATGQAAGKPDDGDAEPITAKPKDRMPETLRRDLAAYRLQAAQVEIARHPAIALDLLVFHVARRVLDHAAASRRAGRALQRSHADTGRPEGDDAAADAAESHRASPCRSTGCKQKTEAAPVRGVPRAARRGQAGPAGLLRGADAASRSWPRRRRRGHGLRCRPVADRSQRRRLLASGQGQLSSAASPATSCWPSAATPSAKRGRRPRAKDKKGALVDQLDRAFADPAQARPDAGAGGEAEKLASRRHGLRPSPPQPKPAKAKKARKAA